MLITGIHQSVVVLRDLEKEPPQGENAPRGRTVVHQIQHGVGFCHDSDAIPQWQGETNGGIEYLLVSNHGPLDFGRWIHVVRPDAWDFEVDRSLRNLQFGPFSP